MSGDAYTRFLAAFEGGDALFGGGEYLAPVFAERVAREGRAYRSGLEWCCGQGHIGLWLLATSAVESMAFVDIISEAILATGDAGKALGLTDRIRLFFSDNMVRVPTDLSFDLVVGNPPSYCNIPSHHELGHLRADPRPSDPGWRIHDRFYRQIGAFLDPGADLFVAEVAPWDERVVFPGIGEWDRRPEPPVETFRRMIEEAGLVWVGCEAFEVLLPDSDEGAGLTLPMGMIHARASG